MTIDAATLLHDLSVASVVAGGIIVAARTVNSGLIACGNKFATAIESLKPLTTNPKIAAAEDAVEKVVVAAVGAVTTEDNAIAAVASVAGLKGS